VSETDEDFAALFEASTQAKRLEKGQTTVGTIVAIGPEVAFVNVGGKGEATIDVAELRNDDGVIEIAVGDPIEATVVSTSGGVVLSRRLALGAATARQLEDAFHAGLPVEGKVEEVVKGGYQVRIARQRAFCPMSQIDAVRTADPAVHEGHVYTFRIIEFGEDGRKFVVSRRALLEEEQRARAAEIRRTIAVGAVMTGRIVSVRDFGAFVDLGAGVQGLLHVSEMGWSRVSDTSQVATPGQEITVKVLRVDEATQQIALGLKQLSADPWTTVPTTYEVGQVRAGRVTRLAPFGAFVELEPGIEGLAHASTFAPAGRSGGWATSLTPGMTGAFEILSIEPERKRIGVALVEEGSSRSEAVLNAGGGAQEAPDEREDTARADAAPSQPFGSLADKLRGALTPREK
jgi:small subunit ribosomal protein S1